MILEIDNVELYYSAKPILRGIYLKAETGKITGLIGRNGSGKSSLLEIIFGSLKPKYGLLRINGIPILKPYYTTSEVGLLTQESFLPLNIKLKTVFKLYGADWKEFKSIFPDFLKDETSKTKSLSFGEKRIIECFIILKGKYKVILLDEPFSSIAPIYAESISKLIQEQKQNKIIILSDHLMNEILPITDTLYILENGCTIKIEDEVQLEKYGFLVE